MSVNVRIPTPLRSLVGGQEEIEVPATSVKEAIDLVDRSYGGFKSRICDDSGKARRFINFYVNQKDIRSLAGFETPLNGGDILSIVPAIAGGTA